MILCSIILLYTIDIAFSCDSPRHLDFEVPYDSLDAMYLSSKDSISIECCSLNGVNKIRWLDNENNTVKTNETLGRYIIMTGKSHLMMKIPKMKKSLYGTYTCVHSDKTINPIKAKLMESTKPNKLKIQEITHNFHSNHRPTFNCGFKVLNPIFLGWTLSIGGVNTYYKLGKGMDKSKFKVDGSKLTITNMTRSYSIWCHYNSLDEVEDYLVLSPILEKHIVIFYNILDPKLSTIPKLPVHEYSNLTIICKFEPFNHVLSGDVYIEPKTEVTRAMYSGYISTKIFNPTREDNGKEFTCTAKTTGISTVLKDKLYLTVLYKPILKKLEVSTNRVTLNSNIFITCTIDAATLKQSYTYFLAYRQSKWIIVTPSSTYKIQLKKKKKMFELKLSIEKVKWIDRGKYRCHAGNKLGNVTETTEFNIWKETSLYAIPEKVYVTIVPSIITCKILGYPFDSNDDVYLKPSSNRHVSEKQLENYKSHDEYFKRYELTLINKESGIEFTRYCVYKNAKTGKEIEKPITFVRTSVPRYFDVSKLCSGSTGIVFKLVQAKEKIRKAADKVVSWKISYSAVTKATKMKDGVTKFKIDNEDRGYSIGVVTGLVPDTAYDFDVKAYNNFSVSSSTKMQMKTGKNSIPAEPKAIKFYLDKKRNSVTANVTLDNKCPYKGVNYDITELSVKVIKIDDAKKTDYIIKKFVVDYENNYLIMPLKLNVTAKYKIQLKLKTAGGISSPIEGEIIPSKLKPTLSKVRCYPKCDARSIFNFTVLIQSLVIAFIIVILY